MSSGHVAITLSIDIFDEPEVLAAGRRSYGRDLSAPWVPGSPVVLPDDVEEVIPDVGQAVTDLLVEAWVRCYGRDALIEGVDAEISEVINREYYPR